MLGPRSRASHPMPSGHPYFFYRPAPKKPNFQSNGQSDLDCPVAIARFGRLPVDLLVHRMALWSWDCEYHLLGRSYVWTLPPGWTPQSTHHLAAFQSPWTCLSPGWSRAHPAPRMRPLGRNTAQKEAAHPSLGSHSPSSTS